MTANSFSKVLDATVGLLAAIPVEDFVSTKSVTLHQSKLWGLDVDQANFGFRIFLSV